MAISFFSTPRQTLANLAKYSNEKVGTIVKLSEEKYAKVFSDKGARSDSVRPKTRWELLRLCMAVAGIEFCYAAETAFVSPIILRLHVPVAIMTFTWTLSPLFGLVLNPLLGSLSDRCRLKMGRRRPFIIGLTLGVIGGLLIVPNGQYIGQKLGEDCDPFGPGFNVTSSNLINMTSSSDLNQFSRPIDANNTEQSAHDVTSGRLCTAGIILTIIGVMILDFSCDASQSPCRTYLLDVCIPEDHNRGLSTFTVISGLGGFVGYVIGGIHWGSYVGQSSFMEHIRIVFGIAILLHIICVFVTVTSFPEIPLDSISGSAERHQSVKKRTSSGKYRKFTNEEDGENHWDNLPTEENGSREKEGEPWKDTVRSYGSTQTETVGQQETSPNYGSVQSDSNNQQDSKYRSTQSVATYQPDTKNNSSTQSDAKNHCDTTQNHGATRSDAIYHCDTTQNYGATQSDTITHRDTTHHYGSTRSASESHTDEKLFDNTTSEYENIESKTTDNEFQQDVSLATYLKSILHLPKSIFWLCLTNLFSWMSLLCYSLYFTDFVGQAVYGGDPTEPEGTPSHNAYAAGVRLGSLAMSLYSLACSVYSLAIEKLVKKIGAKTVYIGGHTVSCVGTIIMALTCHPVAVIVCSPTVGIIYATLFTMPYILLARYHDQNVFDDLVPKSKTKLEIRGLGTDVALVSSMVFVGQIILSSCVGGLIHVTGSTVTVVWTSAVLSLCGAVAALKVMYLDL